MPINRIDRSWCYCLLCCSQPFTTSWLLSLQMAHNKLKSSCSRSLIGTVSHTFTRLQRQTKEGWRACVLLPHPHPSSTKKQQQQQNKTTTKRKWGNEKERERRGWGGGGGGGGEQRKRQTDRDLTCFLFKTDKLTVNSIIKPKAEEKLREHSGLLKSRHWKQIHETRTDWK